MAPMRDDDAELVLAQSLVGRTIVRVEWFDPNDGAGWTEHERAWLWLDDGRVIEFASWGHDAWGASITERDRAECEKERPQA